MQPRLQPILLPGEKKMPDSPRQSASQVVRVTVYSNGSKIKDTYKFSSIWVSRKINVIPVARIELIEVGMAGDQFPASDSDDFTPGAAIRIDAGYGSEEETIFEGIVIRHGIKVIAEPAQKLIIECRDEAVKMTVGRKNANYVDAKDSEIITTLVENCGLAADVEATGVTYKELVQYYCTDWDYMLSRAEVNGLLVIAAGGKISVKPPATGEDAVLEITYGTDIIDFSAQMDARTQYGAVKGVSWDMASQEAVEQEGAMPELNSQGDLSTDELAKVLGLDSFNLHTSAPIDKSGLKTWADAQMQKSGLARITGKTRFQGNAKARPGTLIEAKGVGKRFEGTLFVTAVSHEIKGGNWITEARFGMDADWFAENRDIVTPPASGFLPGVEGLQIGTVIKLDEDPEGEHKVQVALPVMQNQQEGVWARLAKFYGSNGFGSFFIPELGDEVILGYINNDPCHPIVLGSLYSSKNNPPYDLTKDNCIKAILTRSKLLLEFDDDKKTITLTTPANNKIVISDDAQSILIQDQTGNKIELNTGGITMDSPKDIKISAQGKITLDAIGNIEATAKMDFKAKGLNVSNEADIGFTGKGNATAEVSAAGQTTVKGAIVMIN